MSSWNSYFRLLKFDKIDSTNLEAKRLVKAKLTSNLVIFANEQDSGYGRSSKKWVSPKGNLYISIVLHPNKPINEVAQLSFVAALSLYKAISKEISKPDLIKLKWPNDILINGKKVAGIILESSIDTRLQNLDYLILGVGLNIASDISSREFVSTNLKEQQAVNLDPEYYLDKFMSNFIELYDEWHLHGFQNVRVKWLERAYNIHKPVIVSGVKNKISGIFADLDNNGNLLLKLSDGSIKAISGGSIYFDKDF